MKKIKMVGIADAHGIESFVEKSTIENKKIGILALRASLNRQRHAVCYEVEMYQNDIKKVEKEINKKNFILALKLIKKYAKIVHLIHKGMGDVETSWGLIPNPDLDPWR